MRFGGLTAVNDVDLNVHEGEIVGLIGPNGAGKTTFFNCLTGLYIPTEGEVTLQGRRSCRPSRARSSPAGIARTFQNIRLFANMTVLENVLVGRHIRTKAGPLVGILRGPGSRRPRRPRPANAAMELLEFVGLGQSRPSTSPATCPTATSASWRSPAPWPRDPELLLLDEPTAGMNPQETRAGEELIFKIRDSGIAVLVIEHDMRFIFNLCDRVAVPRPGREPRRGHPDERPVRRARHRRLHRHPSTTPDDEEVAEVEREPTATRPPSTDDATARHPTTTGATEGEGGRQ